MMVIALLITIAIFKIYGITGLLVTLGLLVAHQLWYRWHFGYWEQ